MFRKFMVKLAAFFVTRGKRGSRLSTVPLVTHLLQSGQGF